MAARRLLLCCALLLAAARQARAPGVSRPSCRQCDDWESVDGSQCAECPAGQEPNSERTGCDPCDGNGYSSDGGPCQSCDAGKVPTSAHDACENCERGKFADASSGTCETCDPGKQPQTDSTGCEGCKSAEVLEQVYGTSVNEDGETVIDHESEDIASGQKSNLVSLGNGELCTACSAGFQPDDDRASCERCEEGLYSEFGFECRACDDPGYEPTADAASCAQCPAGQYAPRGEVCTACGAGKQVNGRQDDCDDCNDPQVYELTHGAHNNLYSPGGVECESCEAGRAPNTARTDCEMCVAPKVSLHGANCTECEAGQYAKDDQTDCDVCETGKYTDQTVEPPCQACIGRSFADSEDGQADCGECDPGQFAADEDGSNVAVGGGQGNTQCITCDQGMYAGADDLTCQKCPAGAQPLAGMTGCEACADIDDNVHSTDGLECIACLGSGSGEIPATSAASCHCPGLTWDDEDGAHAAQSVRYDEGSYDYHLAGDVQVWSVGTGSAKQLSDEVRVAPCRDSSGLFTEGSCCQACPAGLWNASDPTSTAVNCTDGSLPVINPGVWYREGASDFEGRDSRRWNLFFCPNPEACLGSGPGDEGCAHGYRGPLCASCIPGWAKYSSNACSECPESRLVRVLIGVVFLVCIVGAMGCMVRKNNMSIAPPTVDDVLSGYKKDSELVLVTLKISMSFLQVQSFCANLDLSWPGAQEVVFTAQSAVSEASSTATFAACMLESEETPFILSIAKFYLLLPYLIIAGVCLVYCVIGFVAWRKERAVKYRVSAVVSATAGGEAHVEPARRNAADHPGGPPSTLFDEGFSATVVLLFLIYPSMWKQILVVFSCFTLDPADPPTLSQLDVMQADVGVDCSGDGHTAVKNYAIVTMIVIGAGVPLVSWWQMRAFYHAKQMHTDRARKRYGFLYKGYERPLYFWELVILLRKTCIVVAQMVVQPLGAQMQAIASLLFMLIAMFLNITYKPFIYHQHDTLETLSLLTSALTLLSGLVYNCLADQDMDTESAGALVMFALVCAINVVTVTYAVYVVATTLKQTARHAQQRKEEDEQRKAQVRAASKDGKLDKKALHNQHVQDKWPDMVEKQQKYEEAERTVEAAKVSLGRIAELLPENADDVQLELITALERFDEFLDIGREKCASLLGHYVTTADLAGDELSAEALAQLKSGPAFETETPPPPTDGQLNPRRSPTPDGSDGSPEDKKHGSHAESDSVGGMLAGVDALHL